MLPLQSWFGALFHRFRQRMVGWRDARVRLMNDLLTGIAVVKINAWLKPFAAEVGRIRNKEMRFLIRAGVMDAFNETSYSIFPVLVNLLTVRAAAPSDVSSLHSGKLTKRRRLPWPNSLAHRSPLVSRSTLPMFLRVSFSLTC
jgi:hypothetical protein